MSALKQQKEKILNKLTESFADLDDKIRQCENEIAEVTEIKMRAQEQGDLRENFEYTVALERLGQLNIKMMHLLNQKESWKKFSSSQSEAKTSEYVSEGSCVILENDLNDRYTILIVPELLGNASIGAVSVSSPVGKEVLGKVKGDAIQAITPKGNLTYTIIDIY